MSTPLITPEAQQAYSALAARKERPIIFSGDSARAILEGRKTQTRRVVKPQPPDGYRLAEIPCSRVGGTWVWDPHDGRMFNPELSPEFKAACPCGVPGERLWVRETMCWPNEEDPVYRATDDRVIAMLEETLEMKLTWTPSIFMPRWASRITLEIVKVRVERVQDISEEDAVAEGLLAQVGDGGGPGAGYKWKGVGYHGAGFTQDGARTFHVSDADGKCRCNLHGQTPAQCAHAELWDSINGKKHPWDSNPWVWVIEFKRIEGAH